MPIPLGRGVLRAEAGESDMKAWTAWSYDMPDNPDEETMSPTARSLELLREMGYQAQVVEYYNCFSKKRVDLYGCIDIIAAHPELGILGVQATTGDHHAERWKKAITCPIRAWLAGGGHVQVWSWRKGGKQGKRKLWCVRVQQVTLQDLLPVVDAA